MKPEEINIAIAEICVKANEVRENPLPWRFAVTCATAPQRAEAFLRTLNLWKD